MGLVDSIELEEAERKLKEEITRLMEEVRSLSNTVAQYVSESAVRGRLLDEYMSSIRRMLPIIRRAKDVLPYTRGRDTASPDVKRELEILTKEVNEFLANNGVEQEQLLTVYRITTGNKEHKGITDAVAENPVRMSLLDLVDLIFKLTRYEIDNFGAATLNVEAVLSRD